MLGTEGYRRIMAQCAAQGISLPVIAIGGITAADIPELMATGVYGIAVSGALLGAVDPVSETKKFMKDLKNR